MVVVVAGDIVEEFLGGFGKRNGVGVVGICLCFGKEENECKEECEWREEH